LFFNFVATIRRQQKAAPDFLGLRSRNDKIQRHVLCRERVLGYCAVVFRGKLLNITLVFYTLGLCEERLP